ncbi:MAG: sodium:proton antiporter NhaD [Paludibacter sp.]|jgi:Na+/H+ antiporter NhaD/arsenite permease-like protein|nr:sodium:proton antiporter NhaD [Paludibacter sp.]
MTALIVTVFVICYIAIAMEHSLNVNKTAPALIAGVVTWAIYSHFTPDKALLNFELIEHMGDISSILFFLFGAMTIVELIDAHDGFEIVTDKIRQTQKKRLIWIISLFTFFLSAILDNLTTTIIMVSLLRKLIADKKDRLLFIGMVVIAANAGGVWTPIGDVTTTMLWIGGQISSADTIMYLFLPAIATVSIPAFILSLRMKGTVKRSPLLEKESKYTPNKKQKRNMLVLGVLTLISVPVFKYFTHLPPFMGILLGVAVLWVYTDYLHRKSNPHDVKKVSLIGAIHRVDLSSILFFLGILLAVAALEVSQILVGVSHWLETAIGNQRLITLAIGFLSSVVDNVPLVAATQGMYDIAQYPMNHELWQFLAYCAGTGGSILIIGSAAGVAAMGMEKIDFFWYVKHISWLAALGYLAGAGIYVLERMLF